NERRIADEIGKRWVGHGVANAKTGSRPLYKTRAAPPAQPSPHARGEGREHVQRCYLVALSLSLVVSGAAAFVAVELLSADDFASLSLALASFSLALSAFAFAFASFSSFALFALSAFSFSLAAFSSAAFLAFSSFAFAFSALASSALLILAFDSS